ncbi:MAG: hypothetical protein WCI00_03515 [bacterium]
MPFFIRRLLVSRFESSLFAFKNTLQSIRGSITRYEKYLNELKAIPVVKKGKLPDIEDLLDDYTEFEELQSEMDKIVTEKNGFMIPIEDIDQKFFDDLESDKKFLDGLIDRRDEEKNDPKMESFIQEIQENIKQDKSRKIVVFSQYADTIKELEEKMKEK